MKKIFLAMMALVIGLSFGLATFAQAGEKKVAAAAEETKDKKDKKDKKSDKDVKGGDKDMKGDEGKK